MLRVFWGLALADGIVLVGAALLGAVARGERGVYQHVGLGVFAALLTCLVHAVVFTYFTATGKMMRQALALGKLDGAIDARIRRSKQRISRAVAVAVFTLIVTVAAGAAYLRVPGSGVPGYVHVTAALLALAANLWAFAVEAGLIAANAALMDAVFTEYQRRMGKS
ncbi:MAG TPA: hypothetical protein VGM03_17335 [Phycisphaerae bacterium]|jgi:hypothetical protein